MKKDHQKSGKKANTHISKGKSPKYYYAVGLVTALFVISCGGGDDPIPEPIKTDSATSYALSTSLPTGVSINATTKTVTVPISMTDAKITSFFESGTVTDADGGTGIESVKISGATVKVTYYGTNGKTGEEKTATVSYTLVKSNYTASFPTTLGTNNNITAGNTDFFAKLFATEITLSDGSDNTNLTPSSILVNNQAVDAEHIIYAPDTYTLLITVTGQAGNEYTQSYTLAVNYRAIEKENLSGYTKSTIPLSEKEDWKGRNNVNRANAMGIPGLQKILEHNIIAPSDKITTVLEIGEGAQHVFGDYMKKIIENIGSIQYKLLSLQDYGGNSDDANFRQKLKEKITEYTQNENFLLTEINESARGDGDHTGSTNFGNTFKDNDQVFASFAEGAIGEYEKLAQQGYGKVSLPGFEAENGKRYLYLNRSWTDPESNPFINSIEEPLYVGIDFGASSGASAANAATWALGVDLLHRLDYTVNRSFWNSIFTDSQYNACFEPAYRIDTDGKLGEKGKEYEKGRVLIWDNFVNIFQTFALNTTTIQSLQKGQRVPLMKYWEILDHSYLHIAEEKGIEWKEIDGKSIPYVNYNLLLSQVGAAELTEILANPTNFYNYLIGDKETHSYYWKL